MTDCRATTFVVDQLGCAAAQQRHPVVKLYNAVKDERVMTLEQFQRLPVRLNTGVKRQRNYFSRSKPNTMGFNIYLAHIYFLTGRSPQVPSGPSGSTFAHQVV